MDTKMYVDSLFADYEQSDVLADFKAELQSNLEARIAGLVKKGTDEAAAFDEAAAELRDIAQIADEMCLKKRQEVFADRYMDIQHYIKPVRAVFYALFSVLLLFALVTAAMSWFAHKDFVELFGVFSAFLPVSIAALAFLGFTQETAGMEPMKPKRALWYSAGVLLLFFALTLAPLTWFSTRNADIAGIPQTEPVPAISSLGVIIAFALPAVALFIYLGLTEKPRAKGWVKNRTRTALMHEMELWSDSGTASRFGVITGAIWIFAIAVFALLSYFVSFKISWVAFPLAVGCTLLTQAAMTKK